MKNIIRLLALSMIVGMVLWLAGCTEETTAPTPLKDSKGEVNTIQPTCMITGKIIDRCSGTAISGAVISVGYNGVQTVTSDASGSFSFMDVPASQGKICTTCTVKTGTFLLTASMVSFNSRQTDPAKKYKNFYYDTVVVTYTALDSLAVTGLASDVVFQLNPLTILSGTVVDQSILPVANAIVTINDHLSGTELLRSRTDFAGGFAIAGVETGVLIDIRAKSADGSLEAAVIPYSITCNIPSDSARVQVMHEQIILKPVDDFAPFITNISIANNADVSAPGGILSIAYTFSEPIKQTPYTTNGAGYGSLVDNIHVMSDGLKKTAAEIQKPSIGWSLNNTQLTVNINGLTGSSKYRIYFDSTSVKANLKDLAGNSLRNNNEIVGDLETLNFTTAGGSITPVAPALSRQIIPTVYGPLNYTGGTVSLEWNYNANARSYNIYRSINGGSYDTLATNVRFTQYQTTCPALYTGSLNNPSGTANVGYRVTGVSKDLVEGSASNVITVADEVKPRLAAGLAAPTAVPGATNSWVYTIIFNEPMSQATVENIGNYTFSNTGGVTYTISSATYAGWSSGTQWIAYLQVTSSVAPVAGYIVTTAATITDLAGNGIDPAFNSHTY